MNDNAKRGGVSRGTVYANVGKDNHLKLKAIKKLVTDGDLIQDGQKFHLSDEQKKVFKKKKGGAAEEPATPRRAGKLPRATGAGNSTRECARDKEIPR